MALRLNGQTTGYTELNAPANGDSVVLTMPSTDGNAGQYLQTDGAGALSWQTVTDTNTGAWTELTSSSVSGAETIITGIPSTAIHVRVIFDEIAGNGDWGFRAGTSSGLASTGYQTFAGYWGTAATGASNFTAEWRVEGPGINPYGGQLDLIKRDGNNWEAWGYAFRDDGVSNGAIRQFFGHVALGGALDRVGVTALGATFSAGNIYAWYQEE